MTEKEKAEEIAMEYVRTKLDNTYKPYGETKMMELTRFDGFDIMDAVEYGMRKQKELLIKDSVGGTVSKIGGRVWIDTDDIALERLLNNYEKDAKVKIIIVKEDEQ